MKQLKEDIKNRTFRRVYLLFGEEEYLKRMHRDKIKNAVLADSDDMNYTYYQGKDVDLLQLKESIDTLPFFAEHRLVVLENSGLLKSASNVSEYLEQGPDTTVVVFVEKEIDKRNRLYKYITKNGLAVEMSPMTTRELKAWIVSLLRGTGLQMRESTAEYLLDQIDTSMSNVKNEMDKLIAYCTGKQEITKEDIDSVCCVQVTGKIFQMMDAVANKNRGEALGLYQDLLALRESPMSILYLLTRHFNMLFQAKSFSGGQSQSEMAKSMGVPPFAVKKYMAQCRHFTKQQLKEMLNECIDTEYQFKRGNLGDQIGVELLLISFLQKTA